MLLGPNLCAIWFRQQSLFGPARDDNPYQAHVINAVNYHTIKVSIALDLSVECWWKNEVNCPVVGYEEFSLEVFRKPEIEAGNLIVLGPGLGILMQGRTDRAIRRNFRHGESMHMPPGKSLSLHFPVYILCLLFERCDWLKVLMSNVVILDLICFI